MLSQRLLINLIKGTMIKVFLRPDHAMPLISQNPHHDPSVAK